jgi:homoserine kinase
MSWHRVRAPASSANLGPGLDTLGVALNLYLDCHYRRSRQLSITKGGRDAGHISTAANNLIWQTALSVAARAGLAMPPLELQIDNQIPIAKGLGSSAAARVAGVVIASRTLDLAWERPRILEEAARLEGHPDNVAACVLGSVVAAARDSSGAAQALTLAWPASVRIGLVAPDFFLSTAKARAALPACYSREDAIFNVQRVALLVASLAAGSLTVFREALQDRLHQGYRAPLVPGLQDILDLHAPGLLGCALSGAGPSIMVFHERGSEEVCELVRRIFIRHGHEAEVLLPEIAGDGCQWE